MTVVEENSHRVVADKCRARRREWRMTRRCWDDRQGIGRERLAQGARIGRWAHSPQKCQWKERGVRAVPAHDESLISAQFKMLGSIAVRHDESVET